MRRLVLGAAVLYTQIDLVSRVPAAGPSLGDLIRLRYQHLGIEAGTLPLGSVAASAAALLPFVVLAWNNTPPAEHGLSTSLQWLKQRDLLSVDRVGEIIGNPEVREDVVQSDFGFHAAWELPSRNLRLADQATVEIAEDLWGRFLSGLSAPIQTLTTARRIDANLLVARFERNPRPQAKALAGWLRAQLAGRTLVERRHFVAICAADEQAFSDSVDEINEGLPSLGLRSELIHRLADDELKSVIRRVWSPRKGKGLAPSGPWTVHSRNLQSDLEWHEVLALAKWPRVMRDNWLAAFIDGPYAVDVVQHISPVDPDAIMDKLERRHAGMSASRPNAQRRIALDDIERFMLALEGGEELPFDVATYFHIQGTDRKEVQKDAKRLESRVRRSGGRAQNLRWEQANALVACAPLGVHELKRRTRRVDTSSIRNAYPLTASAMWPEGSVPIGESLESARPIGWTCWARPMIPQPSLFVAANSGGGKGFFTKAVTSRMLFAGETDELYAIDQAEEDPLMGEYGLWAAYCGLDYRYVSSLSDLSVKLTDLHAPGVVWNIAHLHMAERPEAFLKIKEALWKLAAIKRVRRLFVVDELYSFVKPALASGADPGMVALSHNAIEDLSRLGRHMWLGTVWMTQRVKDSLEQPIVQVIQSQAASQLYGLQNAADITHITPILQWTPAEAAAVRSFIPGQFLLVAGPWRVTLRVTASEAEFRMANTDGKVDRNDTLPTAPGLEPDPDPAYRESAHHSSNGRVPALALRAFQPEAGHD